MPDARTPSLNLEPEPPALTAAQQPPARKTRFYTRGVLEAFAYRDYRLLWSGTVVTQIGQWMQQVALGWLVLLLTNSPAFLGLVGFVRGIPMLFLALPAGVVADRFERRKILMIFQAAGALLALTLTLLVWTDYILPWHIIVISALGGAIMAFIGPTRQALVPSFVPKETIANAVAMNSAGQNSTRIIGPSLAGVLISTVGITLCFALQAVGFVWAFIMSFQLKTPPKSEEVAKARASVGANLLEGLRYIKDSPTLSGLMIMAAVPTVLALPYLQILPVFARDVLDVGSTGLGYLMAASGFGGLTGSLLYASYGRRIEHQGRLLIGTGVLLGFILTAFALSPWFPLSLVLVCLTAITTSVYNSVNNTIIQMTVADEFRGRVMSVYLMTWGLMPFGTLPLGIMAGRIGAPFALTIQALLTTVVVVLVALRLPRMRALTAAQPA